MWDTLLLNEPYGPDLFKKNDAPINLIKLIKSTLKLFIKVYFSISLCSDEKSATNSSIYIKLGLAGCQNEQYMHPI